MTCRTYEVGSLKSYKYVVILSEYQGKILLSQHKNRTTWETQGGHIEPGETPMEAARRVRPEFCARAASLVLETDYRLKTSGGDSQRLLEKLILDLAQEKSNG